MSGTSVRTSLSDLISPSCSFLFFFLLIRPPPISTLFPYTTLFRSGLGALVHGDLERPAFVEPVNDVVHVGAAHAGLERDRKSTRLNSSHRCISYAVFCLKKKKKSHLTLITLIIDSSTFYSSVSLPV